MAEEEAPLPDFRGTERFEVRRRLGAGGFGVVYEALDRDNGTLVALKTLRRFDPEALLRFKQEFRALANVVHPNLVRLHELLREDDEWFFTMELLSGVSFLEYVRGPAPLAPLSRRRTQSGLEPAGPAAPSLTQAPTQWSGAGRLHAPTERAPQSQLESWELEFEPPPPGLQVDLQRLRRTLSQVVEGVSALHAAGKLHRDLKPSNVMVSAQGRASVLDFGLVSDVRAPGAAFVAGTPEYMAPEQGAGQALHESSDWYSVGVMLYQALTGAVPFSGPWTQVLRDKQRLPPRAPAARVPGVPADLEALCLELLRVPPQSRPGAAEILRRLGGGGAGPALRNAQASLVGREPHLARLFDAFESARDGRAVNLALHGTSGMGKSALLQHFVERLRWRESRAQVLIGRCYEHESVPYKALDDLVDKLSQALVTLPPDEVEALLPDDAPALARLFPVLRQLEALGRRAAPAASPDPLEQRRRAFGALRELLRRLAARAPLVLCVDDVQWGDADSAALLFEVFRDPEPPAALLVTAYRSDEAESSAFLEALLPLTREPEWGAEPREMVVGELEPAQAGALARELAGERLSQAALDAVVREAEGSPFFIGELVRYLDARAADGSSGAPAPALPEISLQEMILLRVERLDPDSRRLLDVVSVAGRPLPTRVARQAVGLRAEAVDPFARLRSEHLVRTRGSGEHERVEAWHDRIRETVVEALPEKRLGDCHLNLALALEGAGGIDAERLALHFRAGGDLARTRAYAARAARDAAEALAFDHAVRLYRMAFDLHPDEGPERQELRLGYAEALSNAGRGAEAARLYLDALRQAPAQATRELRRRAAEGYLISGHVQEGLQALRDLLRDLDLPMARTPRGAVLSFLLGRARALLRGTRFRARAESEIPALELLRIDTCWSVAVGLALVDPVQGADFQMRHLLLALRAGEPYRVARALAMEVSYSATAGTAGRERTARLLQAARDAAARVPQPHAEGMAWLVHGMARYLEGQWAEAAATLERADAILRERCTGVYWELNTVQIFLLRALIYLGRVRDLTRRLPGLVREARERGDLLARTHLGTDVLYMAELADDKPEQAQKGIDAHLERWGTGTFDIQHDFALHGTVEVSLYDGRPALAWAVLEREWPRLRSSLNTRIQLVRIHAWDFRARTAVAMAEAAPAGGAQRQRFLRAAERDARAIEREHTHWGAPLALLVRAGVAACRGQAQAARALLQAAWQGFEAADMRLHAEVARRRAGELALDEAGRAAVERADQWLLEAGIRRPSRFARMLAPGAWHEIGAPAETPRAAPWTGPRRFEETLRAHDGLRLHVEGCRVVGGSPRACVVLVHGFGEHVGRYAHVMAWLASRGYAVLGGDHRTHGRSAGRPAVYLPSLEPVLDDLEQVCARARALWPGRPLFVYGHSMGAFVALCHALRHQGALAGLVASGVPLCINEAVAPWVVSLARLTARVMPKLPLVGLGLDGISRDPAVVAAYRADPLVHAGRVRARMAVHMNAELERLRARLGELRLPLLVLHGGADAIAPPSGSELLHAQAGSPDRTLRIFPGLFHEIHNEPERQQTLQVIGDWLDEHAPARGE